MGNTKPGSKPGLQVFRRGNYRDFTVTVGEFEPEQPRRIPTAAEAKPGPSQGVLQTLGLSVSDINDAQRRELKIKGGVKVDAVDGVAARAGLREGDVILAVANTDITDAKQFESMVAKLDKSKPFNVLFRRGEWAQYAVIRPSH